MEAKMFFGGIPTKPEVDKLMALAKDRAESEVISYKEIEACIGCGRRTNRGGSIVSAFRKRMFRERNIVLVADKNNGYRLANPEERIEVSGQFVAFGKRRIMRAAAISAATDASRLSEANRKLREHFQGIPARLKLAELTAPKS